MKKFILIIDGPMGAGKTTVSKIVHGKIRNTALIGLDKIKWFLSDFKRTKTQNEMTRKVVFAMAKTYLSQKVNVIVEQLTKKPQISKYRKLALALGAKLLIYQLEAPKAVLLKRVAGRKPLPGRIKVSSNRVIKNISFYYRNKTSDATILDTTKLSPRQIANSILKDLKRL
jgi:cytidylate kinase